ncbi:MAG: hypothetical protein V1775_08325 [Bacteroidota bacterium]
MAKITIQTKDSWIAWFSSYKVYLDGERIGKISNGFEDSFEIAPGNHSLQIKFGPLNIYASPELGFGTVDEKETAFIAGFTAFAGQFEMVATILIVIAIILSSTILDRPFVYYIGLLIGLSAFFLREKFIYIRLKMSDSGKE